MTQKKLNTNSKMARTIQALEKDPNSTISDLAQAVHGSRVKKDMLRVYASLSQWRKRGVAIGPAVKGGRVMCLGFDLTDYTDEEMGQYHTSYIKRIRSHKNSLRIHDSKVIEKSPHMREAFIESVFKALEDEKTYYEDITQKHKRIES